MGLVTARGVEDRNTYLCASITFYGVRDWIAVVNVKVAVVAIVTNFSLAVLVTKCSNPPVEPYTNENNVMLPYKLRDNNKKKKKKEKYACMHAFECRSKIYTVEGRSGSWAGKA